MYRRNIPGIDILSAVRLALLLIGTAAAGSGQRTYRGSSRAAFVGNAALSGIVLHVKASAPTCGWTAAGRGFATGANRMAALFSEVSPTINHFNAASLISQSGIAAVYATTPGLQHRGEHNGTRRQMAVFIVRTSFGGAATRNSLNSQRTRSGKVIPCA